ncbi:MAG: beta-ketoacyl-ACP synthase II [Chloroflexi bacterium]|nr:beta-ketoacyl-ACP synthase II [Chloroflexota bacterium]
MLVNNTHRPRAVVTGLGAITPIGLDVPTFWEGLLEGRSGVRRVTRFDASHLPCQIVGEVLDFDPKKYMDGKEARRMSRSAQMAIAASIEAVADAGLPPTFADPERAGVSFGTAIGGVDRLDEETQILRAKGYTRVSPFAVPSSMPNMAAHHVTRQFQALGPSSTLATACATGTQAVGEGAEYIRRGIADIVITGGVDAVITDFGLGGFAAMRGLATSFNDRPEKASRPFDKDREGFVYSEGCGVLVLERLEHALARGARIYAEVLGHASSSDGYHMAAPDPEAAGAVRAMKWALADAGLATSDIAYINAHCTSTLAGDALETLAIKRLFGEAAYSIPISATKSMIGHPLGAAGALEAIACALTIRDQIIHPTINYETPDPECDLDYVANVKRAARVRRTLSNSFGLGGQNACLVLGEYQS